MALAAAMITILPASALEPLDLAVPLTLYTVATTAGHVVHGHRPRAALLATALVSASPRDHAAGRRRFDTERDGDHRAGPAKDQSRCGSRGRGRRPDDPHAGPTSCAAPGGLLSTALGRAVGVMLILGLAFAMGDGVRSRRAHLRTMEKRAADLEREQHQRVALPRRPNAPGSPASCTTWSRTVCR